MEGTAIATLFAWALHFYAPTVVPEPPQVRLADHSFFVSNACGGRDCKVLGWYPGSGDIVYVDQAMPQSLVAQSILLHEMVHYLQWRSGAFDLEKCEDRVAAERQAHDVQRKFLEAHGVWYWPQAVQTYTCK